MAYDENLAERVRAALAGRADVVEKRMFGGVAFMVRGHMSCGILASTLMVRLVRRPTAF
jgi:TfoX/Sxy family transcriptional regulator of competence genes